MKNTEQKPLQILFLTSRLPYPPDRGDKVRTNFLLNKFNEMGKVTLISLVNENKDQASIDVIRKVYTDSYFIHQSKAMSLFRMFSAVFTKLPFQVAFYQNNQVNRLIAKLFNQQTFDLVYVHLIRMAPYALIIPQAKVILDMTDCISMEYKRSLPFRRGLSRLFFSIEANRTEQYERFISDHFDEIWVISPIDKAAIVPNHKIVVIPNLVIVPDCKGDYNLHNKLIFTGNMSVPHNIHAAKQIIENIMPVLIKFHPDLQFHIIGAGVTEAISSLNGIHNTVVRGFVPDLYKALSECDIFIAPMYFCAGIQNKVLEAMVCGLPVVTTRNVANSLSATDGDEMIIAENNAEFVTKTLSLLADSSLREKVGRRGREKIVYEFSPESVSHIIESRVSALLNI